MTMQDERTAADVLQCFLTGDARAADLDAVARRLGVTSLSELCENLAAAFGGLLRVDLLLSDVARKLSLFLNGKIARDEMSLWVNCAHSIVTSDRVHQFSPQWDNDTRASAGSGLGPTLRLLSFLFDPQHTAPQFKIRSTLFRILRHLNASQAVPLRGFLPSLFRDMGMLRFFVVANPPHFSLEAPNQWVDVGLAGTTGDDIRLIPLSIFTRRFFHDELPGIVSDASARLGTERCACDRFAYHPENNQAISLLERYPDLNRIPVTFQYFIDENGLAEIIIQAQEIRREHVRFAVKLFCLQNEVGRAMLDDHHVSCAQGAPWAL